jgi:hypothetical protein
MRLERLVTLKNSPLRVLNPRPSCLYHLCYRVPYIPYYGNIFTELLPINDKEKYVWAHRLMGVIYEAH